MLITLFLVFLPQTIKAATVRAIKDRKVLFFMERGEFSPGQRILAITRKGPQGKVFIKGILLVRFVKDRKAIGTLEKGTVQVGMTLIKIPSRKKHSQTKRSFPRQQSRWATGILLGGTFNILHNSLPTKVTGIGPSLKAHLDWDISSALSLRVSTGLDAFKTQKQFTERDCIGKNSQGVIQYGNNCLLNINYLTFDGWLRYAFIHTSNKAWVGVGTGVRTPSKRVEKIKNTAGIEPKSISTIAVAYFGLGLDLAVGRKLFIPIYAHYTLFPKGKKEKNPPKFQNISFGLGLSFKL